MKNKSLHLDLDLFYQSAIQTFKRFYSTFFFALLGTISGHLFLVQKIHIYLSKPKLGNVMYVSFLGIGLSISLNLFAERHNYNFLKKFFLQILGLLILLAHYLFLPLEWTSYHYLRSALIIFSFHCLVSFAAFFLHDSMNGFWQFNKNLFFRILTSLLYTFVLYLGISLALVVVINLFNLDISGEVYTHLWIVLIGLFNTWFFLAGVPSNLNELDLENDYPKGLKVFTQFILIPLATIYFLIMYSYMLKMIWMLSLPKGAISYLVISFSFFGILSLLLIYPLQNKETEKWIKIFARWFYIALLPLIGLLLVAIGTRIKAYGITENRYLIILLAAWLSGISIYLQLNKLHNIKIIPQSLCLILLLASFGPWGASAVSEKSQLSRLQALLVKNNLLSEGRLLKPKIEITIKDQNEISSLLEYFKSNHGNDYLLKYFQPKEKNQIVNEIKKHLEIKQYFEEIGGKSFDFSIPNPNGVGRFVRGYDYFFERSFSIYNGKFNELISLGDKSLVFVSDSKKITIKYENELFEIEFKPLYEKLIKSYKTGNHYSILEKDMTYTFVNKSIKLDLIFTYFGGGTDLAASGFNISTVNIRGYVKIKTK